MQAPPIAAIVLAAGRSARMGAGDKLLLEFDGEPLVRRAARTALVAGFDVTVVVAASNAGVIAALNGLDVRVVENHASAEGIASSIRHGIEAVAASHAGALILLADMPLLAPDFLLNMADAFATANDSNAIIVPRFRGRRGNPVLWGCAHFSDLLKLRGDTGARGLLERHAAHLRFVEAPNDCVLIDVDTPQDRERLRITTAS